jgi:hypothetical protein
VVGIVAAKIVEAYHRPTFLLHINGDTARGSGRSIPAFNLLPGPPTLRAVVTAVWRSQICCWSDHGYGPTAISAGRFYSLC